MSHFCWNTLYNPQKISFLKRSQTNFLTPFWKMCLFENLKFSSHEFQRMASSSSHERSFSLQTPCGVVMGEKCRCSRSSFEAEERISNSIRSLGFISQSVREIGSKIATQRGSTCHSITTGCLVHCPVLHSTHNRDRLPTLDSTISTPQQPLSSLISRTLMLAKISLENKIKSCPINPDSILTRELWYRVLNNFPKLL